MSCRNETRYKVLDIREYEDVTVNSSAVSYGSNQKVRTDKRVIVVAICLNLDTNKRERMEFYPAYIDTFLGNTNYYGYKGDYNLLVPGDIFQITETSNYDCVNIVTEE